MNDNISNNTLLEVKDLSVYYGVICALKGINFEVGEGEIVPGKKGLEAAAREARYAFLRSLDGTIATAHTADDNAETAWLINTFTVNNMLSLGKERLSGRVSVEDIPSGHRHLTSIMEAMTENREIRIQYQKYTRATRLKGSPCIPMP